MISTIPRHNNVSAYSCKHVTITLEQRIASLIVLFLLLCKWSYNDHSLCTRERDDKFVQTEKCFKDLRKSMYRFLETYCDFWVLYRIQTVYTKEIAFGKMRKMWPLTIQFAENPVLKLLIHTRGFCTSMEYREKVWNTRVMVVKTSYPKMALIHATHPSAYSPPPSPTAPSTPPPLATGLTTCVVSPLNYILRVWVIFS